MASAPQTLKLSDLAAFGAAPSSSPVQPKPLTMQDLQAYGAQPQGFFSSAGDQLSPKIIGGIAGATVAPRLALAAGLADASRSSTESPEEVAAISARFKTAHDAAADAIKRGDYLGAARQAQDLFLGEGLKEPVDKIEDQIAAKNYSGAAGSAVGFLGQFALGHGFGKLLDATPALASRAYGAATKVDPDIALTQALKPRPAGPDFIDTLPKARADIKQAEVSKGPMGHPNADEPIHFNPMTSDPDVAPNNLIATIQRAKAGAMQALDTFIDPLRKAGAQLDGNKVADAMEAEIPTGLKVEARKNPASADQIQAIKDQASGLRQPLSIDDVRDMLRETNAQLNSLYHGTPDAQASKLAAAGGPAMLEAKARGLRQIFYDAAGPEAADLNKRWGIMDNLEAAAQARRIPTVTGEQSASLLDKATKLGKAVTHFDPVAIQEALGKTDQLVRGAFENTQPGGVYPTYRSPQRLLGSGPVVLEPPADTSFVRGVPAMTQPPNPARALPPGSTPIITPPPADTSGLQVFDAARQIARDPKTGRMFRYYTSGRAPRPLSDLEMKTVGGK